ncbi:protein FAM91A1 isoform X2 [Macrosteles quadrilineatus]|uniref:protein FAM91A1 isoform X2 n=1 Tax=Macrosteles quadrilineatus TaxID=74068 RepID=UPI0023E0FAA9|nr:protein FAM91A1 isoform X2 [Macrosteles quadrilineatus]
MNNDVELYIRQNIPWQKLPPNIKQSLGNSQKEYEKHIVNFSVKNQLRYKGNLVRLVRKDERRYYEEVLSYSRTGLLLYPYHLSDIMVEGLRVTPFQYYTSVLEAIMDQERSYDSLPNFTAADCLRLLGIGRNEYIDLMNQCRSGRKLFRRKNVRDLLPSKPVDVNIEPWWLIAAGCIVEEDIKLVSNPEKELIDRIIDHGKQRAGDLNKELVHSLYKKGLVYLEVPIEDSNYIVVPPLEGFVMNRVLGDYFETLLYKIFVSIDEHTSVGELANVLQIDSQLVKNAVSLYCRLGFARKKSTDSEDCHPSWKPARNKLLMSPEGGDPCLLDLSDALAEAGAEEVKTETIVDLDDSDLTSPRSKRICFLFDSTLTAFLMMGNLSPGLKSHAVTMFEVGKLLDESIDGFLCELEKVSTARDDSEGEARRYFEHALILRSTILALRHSTSLHAGLDLVRCESLYPLEPETRNRLLAKNYSLLVSMAPLSKEIRPITSKDPPHLGPASPDVNTIWFKLFIYHITKDGPPSILLTRGTRLRKLPSLLRRCDKVLVTSWGHDPAVIPLANLLFALNDALTYSPVLAQAYGVDKGAETVLVPFPFKSKDGDKESKGADWTQHDGITTLCEELDLEHTCGYVTMAKLRPTPSTTSPLRLQLTPTTAVRAWVDKCPGVSDVQSSSSPERPKNGFHSKECADILKQELDNLSEGKVSASSVSSSPNKVEEPDHRQTDVDVSAWTILDCCFGVPLFEAEVNHSICATIVDKLAGQESLDLLSVSNERLSTRLKQFISYFHDLNKTQNVSNTQDDLIWPKSNLIFFKGKLREWDGK